MARKRRKNPPSLAQRSTLAAEAAVKHAAAQAEAARRQHEEAKRTNRTAKWAIIATVLVSAATVAGTYGLTRHDEASRTQRTYAQQIETEIEIARQLKSNNDDFPANFGPLAAGGPDHIRSAASQANQILADAENTERQHELREDRDSFLEAVYITRHEVFFRMHRALQGAIIQAYYQAQHANEPGEHMTANYAGAAINTTMALNLYVHAIQDAAVAHHIPFPNDLWSTSPNFTGPMMDDSN